MLRPLRMLVHQEIDIEVL